LALKDREDVMTVQPAPDDQWELDVGCCLNRAGFSEVHFISKTVLPLVTLGFEGLRNCGT
jgi:hypothetical protein